MRTPIISLLLLYGAVAGADDAAGWLRASIEPARFDIAPLAAGTRFIVPPALTVELTIEAACAAEADAESLAVSIADTQLLLGAADLAAPVSARLDLPGAQLAPLRVDEFCRLDDEGTPGGEKLVENVYTARVSLRCATGDAQSIVYATLPVDVWIRCDDGGAEAAGLDLAAE